MTSEKNDVKLSEEKKNPPDQRGTKQRPDRCLREGPTRVPLRGFSEIKRVLVLG